MNRKYYIVAGGKAQGLYSVNDYGEYDYYDYDD